MMESRPATSHLALVLMLLATCVIRASAEHEYLVDPSTTIVASACLGTTPILTLECPGGSMVQPIRVFYGHSSPGLCSETPGDCTLDVPDKEDYSCVGRSRCDINLPTGNMGKVIPKCQLRSTFIQVHFLCVPETLVVDICGDITKVEGQTGYISSPSYPNNYSPSLRCNLTVTTPYSSQRIKLWVIDLNLEVSDSDCSDWLHVFDGYRGNTMCNQRSRTVLLTSGTNYLEISFYSNAVTQTKGFWLYYEAIPYIPVTVPPSTASTLLLPSATSRVTPATAASSAATVAAVAEPREGGISLPDIPLVVILGVIFGTILCILVTVLLVLLIRRKRSHCKPSIPPSSSLISSSSAAFLTMPNTSLHSHLATTTDDLYYKQHTHDPCQNKENVDSAPCPPINTSYYENDYKVQQSRNRNDHYDLEPESQRYKYYKQRDLHLTIANTCYNNSQCDITPDDSNQRYIQSPRHVDLDLESIKALSKKSKILNGLDSVEGSMKGRHQCSVETSFP